MEKHYFFDRNLLALSAYNAPLCGQLSAALTTKGHYRFVEARDGAALPAWVDKTGAAHVLHSLVAPEREAEKLVNAQGGGGFIIIMGLGAAYLAEAALAKGGVEKVVVIDYNINSVAELICSKDYVSLFGDIRFTLLVDPPPAFLEKYITECYHPSVHNGLCVIPLRSRCEFDMAAFLAASEAVRAALERLSSDYSVQAHFGTRWFSNIIRNLFAAENQHGVLAPIHRAAVCAAGPSLDLQLDALRAKRGGAFVIATDTALGTLLAADMPPDAVISIDCQHISYHHFLNADFFSRDIPLFLDLASPPLLAGGARKSFFFSGGHPLARYIDSNFKEFLKLDTSGANVTYAAVSLAERLGAKTIELYGADFSYPEGMTYTRGAYFYPYLRNRARRFNPAFAQLSAFIYAIPSLEKHKTQSGFRYETRSLAMYSQKLDELSSRSAAVITHAGAARARSKPPENSAENTIKLFGSGRTQSGAKEFLEHYCELIAALPLPDSNIEKYLSSLSPKQRAVFFTLLPTAAGIKKRRSIAENAVLIEQLKIWCLNEIENLLRARDGSKSL
ncbi:MAG: DUF115 domain-containing protein [Spirochaetaceae bacterium]|jgi:hypothetical protein|nr:DUF115 domain-containing protein [Spirochaetaceae bacterium]